ncbi:MAG: [FeFe] hydrogenase H-cluster maturation GTPase HydF [Lachnospiraceae bacterium]|nr:[FeFe] hydrogenase H-cluster maturation GTPase HydF [Lachnospiraceae bacterium]
MGTLNETANADRFHIGIFGCRNVGKSSLINAITNQEVAVVSEVKGTTTDPVSKAMELLPLGPVLFIDTPGLDDDDALLGKKRIERAKKVLNRVDIALLVVSALDGIKEYDLEIEKVLIEKNIPYIVVINKSDLTNDTVENIIKVKSAIKEQKNIIEVSARTGKNIEKLKELMGSFAIQNNGKSLVGDIVKKDDLVILVTPIDESAPKGRMILPQIQVLRDILDHDGKALFTKETELLSTLKSLAKKPDFVITDSQAFKTVHEIVPLDVPLTSFSIILARYKGFLKTAVDGVNSIKNIKEGDTILIAEGCTHHRQCNDIGTTKIPKLLKNITGVDFHIVTSSGNDFPEDLSPYKMIIHCGGCMVNEREMRYRMKCAVDAKVPFMNYGIFIAYANGILERSIKDIPLL